MAKRTTMLLTQSIMAGLVVAVNVGVLISMIELYPPGSRGVGTISIGNCTVIGQINTVIHLAFNILSSLFLGAGNYCMQITIAPTRDEIDEAHRQGAHLKIGILSIRNLGRIHWRRSVRWFFISLVSTILHLLYVGFYFPLFPLQSRTGLSLTSRYFQI